MSGLETRVPTPRRRAALGLQELALSPLPPACRLKENEDESRRDGIRNEATTVLACPVPLGGKRGKGFHLLAVWDVNQLPADYPTALVPLIEVPARNKSASHLTPLLLLEVAEPLEKIAVFQFQMNGTLLCHLLITCPNANAPHYQVSVLHDMNVDCDVAGLQVDASHKVNLHHENLP